MARYFLNIGTNWQSTANWSDTDGGAGGFSVPTSADDVFLTANSGNCSTTSTLGSAKTLTCTGYINTLTITGGYLQVYGDIILGAGMSIVVAANQYLVTMTTATLTTNGIIIPRLMFNGPSAIVTLADNCNATLLIVNSLTTINGNTIYVGGCDAVGSLSGTSNFVFNGTGTWTSGGGILQTATVTINTTGTLTLSSFVYVGNTTYTYIAGTLITTSATMSFTTATTINTNVVVWPAVYFALGGGVTHTLTSDLIVQGQVAYQQNGTLVNGPFNIYAWTINCVNCGGTASFILNGTGWWYGSVGNPVTINTAGVVNFGNTVGIGNVALTYVAGTINPNSSTFFVSSTTFVNCSSIKFYNMHNQGNAILTSDLHILNNFTSINNLSWAGIYNVYIGGNFAIYNSLGGTHTFILNGTTTWIGTGSVSSNVTIDTSGIITIDERLVFTGVKVFTYIKGKIKMTKRAALDILNSHTFVGDMGKFNFPDILITSAVTLTMSTFFKGSAKIPTRVRCATSTSTYTLNFTGSIDVVTWYIRISNAVITNGNGKKLVVITRFANKGSNVGVKFINQSAESFAKGTPSISILPMIADFITDPICLTN